VWNLVSHIKRGTYRLRVFQNTVLGRYSGIRGRKEKETGENCIMRSIMIGTPHRMLLE
jgi:hypothetical protein